MPPKTKYATLALTAIALIGAGIYLGSLLNSSSRKQAERNRTVASAEEIELIRSIPKPKAPDIAELAESETASLEINALARLNDVHSDPQTDIHIIEHLLAQVHTVFHELPTGEHDEIVAFLRGANSRDIVYIPEDDPNLNDDGKIIDRWGTPYFFHTLSRHRIEVRSAGPDRLHWSEDDIITESQSTES